MTRPANRQVNELRPVEIQRDWMGAAPGRVLISAGRTVVVCTASVDAKVPAWLEGKGKGWITAEYNMLPGSTAPRKRRDRSGKVDGRTTEIQRLIGRSLRAVADLEALGEQLITVDCDVLQADGGTRTLSITGAFVAMADAIGTLDELPFADRHPLKDSVAAVSVGIHQGQVFLDLEYVEDVAADVDMNVVMTGRGRYVEIQGTGEEATFGDDDLSQLLDKARHGVSELTRLQRESLGKDWPLA